MTTEIQRTINDISIDEIRKYLLMLRGKQEGHVEGESSIAIIMLCIKMQLRCIDKSEPTTEGRVKVLKELDELVILAEGLQNELDDPGH